MKKMLIGATALLTALTGVVAGAGPAEARDGGGYHGGGGYGYRGGGYHGGYGGGYGYRGNGVGTAVFAGLAGLAVGAALTQPRHGYYGRPDYYPGYRGYYGPPPAYYVGPSYYGWYEGCRREWVWSPRWGTYHLVDACY